MFLIPLIRPAGTGLLVALALTSCTQKKDGPTYTPGAPPTTTTPTTPAASNSAGKDFAEYTELAWSDEFTGSGAPDATKWGYDLGNNNGWGNQELETYTNSTDNVTQAGGNLVITAKQQGTGYTSGRILTKGKQDFQYGRVDVRAKLPQTQGIWPAIWMLGSEIDTNNWPKCGEIDIMELRGQEPTKILTTMHYANTIGGHEQGGIDNIKLPDGSSFADDFHVFTTIRSQNQIRFYLDGRQYYTFTNGTTGSNPYPFNNNFFVVLNVAVGGNFLGNPNTSTVFPQQMLVDYVRLYKYKE